MSDTATAAGIIVFVLYRRRHTTNHPTNRCAQLKWIMPDWFPTKWVSLFTQVSLEWLTLSM